MADTSALAVMCVDDDAPTRELLRLAVEQQDDLELVAMAGQPHEVTTLLRQHRPDVLVLDHRLAPSAATRIPGSPLPVGLSIPQTGLELVEAARAIVHDLIIIVFSGQEGLGTAAGRVGADAYIEKPEIDAIWPAIHAAHQRRRDPNLRIDLRHDDASTRPNQDR
jgi:DNA-binding NarL/FixJ family response regulator